MTIESVSPDDLERLVREARRMRSEYLAQLWCAGFAGFVSLLKKCWGWLSQPETRDRDAYFSRATDVADLERRIRAWERYPSSLFR